jgi:uncharacterized membrane protein
MTRRYDNQGRDQIPIENVYGNVSIGATRSRKRPDRETTWLKAFEKEIDGRLATSLHNQILINLGKQVQPEQVQRLWDMEVKSGQMTETILPETEILEVFDRVEIAGKLLILGKPGAGKTTTLLELARALVRKAIDDPSEPMPFLLNLSSWKDPKRSIKDWAISELVTKGVGSKIGAKWIAEKKVLPLFDGLDEVRSDLQPACVSAINQFLSGEEQPLSIVVCSRREEYELYPEKLNLHGAIYLQELSDRQIESYLNEINRASLWQVLETDVALLDLVRQPLWLSITLEAYRKELAGQWEKLLSTQERLTFLLDAYVERMLRKRINSQMYVVKAEPNAKQTHQWLVTLAKQLQNGSETEFLIERMQPSWLRLNALWKSLYILIVALIFGIVYGLVAGITFGVRGGLIFGIVYGLLALAMSTFSDIKPVEKSQFSFRALRKLTNSQIAILVVMGIMIGVMTVGVILEVAYGTLLALVSGAFSGLIFALILGLIKASKAEIEISTYPNQGIHNSTKNAFVAFTISLIIALIIQIALYPLLNHVSLKETVQKGTAFILFAFIFYSLSENGGQACIQHFSLRFVLFCTRAIPWNYARFLNYATERMFLQRIGGRYRFIHKFLQDHFAAMSNEN